MERVKDLNKLIIQDDMVLIKIKEKNSLVISSSNNGPEIEYSTIVLKGSKFTRGDIGDVVILMSNMTLEVYQHKGEQYALIPEFTIKMCVTPDNFDESVVKPGKLIIN